MKVCFILKMTIAWLIGQIYSLVCNQELMLSIELAMTPPWTISQHVIAFI
jgi:hypothetical protein